MATDPTPRTGSSTTGRWTLRGGAALAVVALLLGGPLLLVEFEKERPDYCESARIPITEAGVILSETYAEEHELVQQLDSVHARLDHAIGL